MVYTCLHSVQRHCIHSRDGDWCAQDTSEECRDKGKSKRREGGRAEGREKGADLVDKVTDKFRFLALLFVPHDSEDHGQINFNGDVVQSLGAAGVRAGIMVKSAMEQKGGEEERGREGGRGGDKRATMRGIGWEKRRKKPRDGRE
jgi:hypothetical protein